MIRVGVIDSGGPFSDHALDGYGHKLFYADGRIEAAQPDRLGHGTAVDLVIRRACRDVAIRHAQVFEERPVTSAARVSAALHWLGGLPAPDRPHLICLSLGLRADRQILRDACGVVAQAGILLVAAHPAQGVSCYPAAYSDVIAATGDARCGWDDVSMPRENVMGAWCNSPEHGRAGMGGASIGTARVTGHLADLMRHHGPLSAQAAQKALMARCRHVGPERKGMSHA